MKKLLVTLFIGNLIFLAACNQQNGSSENTQQADSTANVQMENQSENTIQAVYFEHAELSNLSFIFYFEKNGILSPLIIRDNGEKELEELRNPQNYNKLFELKTTQISSQFEEIEQYFADSIKSAVQINENQALLSRVIKETYLQYIFEMDEVELPLAINKESFDLFESKAIGIPNKFFWLYANKQNKFVDVRQEYGYTEGNKYQPEMEIFDHGKIPTYDNAYDLFLISELPFRTKLGADGEMRIYKLCTFSKSGERIAELTFARDYSIADDLMITGIIEEDLSIKITQTLFDENANEVLNYDNFSYTINKNGEIIQDKNQ